jgi:hypothetical protein
MVDSVLNSVLNSIFFSPLVFPQFDVSGGFIYTAMRVVAIPYIAPAFCITPAGLALLMAVWTVIGSDRGLYHVGPEGGIIRHFRGRHRITLKEVFWG